MSPAQSHHPEGLMLSLNLNLALRWVEEAENSGHFSVLEGAKGGEFPETTSASICLICVRAFSIFS